MLRLALYLQVYTTNILLLINCKTIWYNNIMLCSCTLHAFLWIMTHCKIHFANEVKSNKKEITSTNPYCELTSKNWMLPDGPWDVAWNSAKKQNFVLQCSWYWLWKKILYIIINKNYKEIESFKRYTSIDSNDDIWFLMVPSRCAAFYN